MVRKAPARKRPPRRVRKNAAAAKATVAALDAGGRLEEVDRARVVAFLSIAEALDDDPHNAQLWREYREAFEGLRYDDDDAPDALESLLEEMRAEVRDSEEEP